MVAGTAVHVLGWMEVLISMIRFFLFGPTLVVVTSSLSGVLLYYLIYLKDRLNNKDLSDSIFSSISQPGI